jgi:hypothetical protein
MSLPLWTMPRPNERGWTVVALEEAPPHLLGMSRQSFDGGCHCRCCREELALPALPEQSL